MAEQDKTDSGLAKLSGGQLTAIHCLMIPVSSEILLLPNAAIAEVAAYQVPEPDTSTNDWLLGRINWRDYRVPVISFELLTGTGSDTPINKSSRIAILNTLNGNSKLPYIGMITQGIPHLQVVQEKNIISNHQGADKSECIKEYVMLNGEPAAIPDIDEIEKRILL